MKTLIGNLKFGALIVSAMLLFSCSTRPVLVSAIGFKTVNSSVPVMANAAKKYTGNKLSSFFKYSSATKKGNSPTKKKNSDVRKTQRVRPISIGLTGDFQLASSIDR
jgi:hypothetical protein